jgi:hypothetical protein
MGHGGALLFLLGRNIAAKRGQGCCQEASRGAKRVPKRYAPILKANSPQANRQHPANSRARRGAGEGTEG